MRLTTSPRTSRTTRFRCCNRNRHPESEFTGRGSGTVDGTYVQSKLRTAANVPVQRQAADLAVGIVTGDRGGTSLRRPSPGGPQFRVT